MPPLDRHRLWLRERLDVPGRAGRSRGGRVVPDSAQRPLTPLNLGGVHVYVDATNRSALAGANLAGARLDGLTLVGFPADFTGTVFDGASMIGAHFDLADFAGASLHNVKAHMASFRGARFRAHGNHPAASFAGGARPDERSLYRGGRERRQLRRGDPDRGRVQPGARCRTSFSGVSAEHANFADAHIYGDGQAFHQATTLRTPTSRARCWRRRWRRAAASTSRRPSSTAPRSTAPSASAATSRGQTAGRQLHERLPARRQLRRRPTRQGDPVRRVAVLRRSRQQRSRCARSGRPVAVAPGSRPGRGVWSGALPADEPGAGGSDGGHRVPGRPGPSRDRSAATGICSPIRSRHPRSRAPARPPGSAPVRSPSAHCSVTERAPCRSHVPRAPAYWATIGTVDQGLLVAFDDGTVRRVTSTGKSTLVAGMLGQRCLGGATALWRRRPGDGSPARTADGPRGGRGRRRVHRGHGRRVASDASVGTAHPDGRRLFGAR